MLKNHVKGCCLADEMIFEWTVGIPFCNINTPSIVNYVLVKSRKSFHLKKKIILNLY